MPLRFILILVFALLPLPATAISLVPVSWNSAGFDPGPFARGSDVLINCSFGCPSSASVPITSPDLSIDFGPLQMSADLVSEVSGNRWTFGIQNISVVAPTVTNWDIDLVFEVSAQLDVPSGTSALTTMALISSPVPFQLNSVSGFLGPGNVSTGFPVEFISGDQVDVFTTFDLFASFGSSSFTSSPCGSSMTTDLSDCLVTIDLFQVVVTPEPSPVWLLGTLVVGVLYRQRTRSRGLRMQ